MSNEQANPALVAPRSPRRMAFLVALLLGAAGAMGWFFIARPAANDAKPVAARGAASGAPDRPVLVRKVAFAPAASPRLLVGTLRARVEGDQGFRVAGKIVRRHVQVGDHVKAGGLIASLDPTDLVLQRETAEAEQAAAASSERQARQELARITELRARGWSTEQALDRQRAALDEAVGRSARAERNVGIARNAQSYSELRAEHDGIVTALYVEVGQVVPAGQAILRIARDGDREAQIAVPEHELALVQTAGASVALWSRPDHHHAATLREVSPSADPATRTFLARFSIADLPADTPIGMTVTLALQPPDLKPVARLPISAVLNEGGGTEVYVVDAGTGELKRRPIRVQSYTAQDALVSSGLMEGDVVVTMGIHTLRPGQKVRTIPDARQG